MSMADDELEDLFDAFDKNNDGYIARTELVYGDKSYRRSIIIAKRQKEEFREQVLKTLENHAVITEDIAEDIKNTLRTEILQAGTKNISMRSQEDFKWMGKTSRNKSKS